MINKISKQKRGFDQCWNCERDLMIGSVVTELAVKGVHIQKVHERPSWYTDSDNPDLNGFYSVLFCKHCHTKEK